MYSLIQSKEQKERRKKAHREQGGPGGDLHGTLSPQRSRSCRRHWSRIFVFSPPLSVEEYKFIIQPGTGRSPLPLLSSVLSGFAPGSFSCMVDILLNASFLDDMGDHSKSKFRPIFCSGVSHV